MVHCKNIRLEKNEKKNRHQHKLFPIATPYPIFIMFFLSKSNLSLVKMQQRENREIEAYHVQVMYFGTWLYNLEMRSMDIVLFFF